MLPSWVSSWCYQQMSDYTGKGLPVTNTLAYLASSSATEETSFITLTPGQPKYFLFRQFLSFQLFQFLSLRFKFNSRFIKSV
jgi:hypothetical protein